MATMMRAARAYQASADNRSLRAQEADVFMQALAGSPVDRVRALADNRRLWLTVVGVVMDPDNKLPAPLRASIVSVGRSVQREMDTSSPNLAFLIAVNENLVAGLCA